MARVLDLTRELVNRLPEKVDAQGPVRVSTAHPDYYDTTADTILAAMDPDHGLWVFAIGSLIWNPRCPVVARRPAHVRGWRRSFCLGPMMRHRGNPDAPGRMLSLDRGGECPGIILQMDPDNIRDSLIGLLKLEPPIPPEWVQAETEHGNVPAIAFAIRPDFAMYAPEPPEDELADLLASAVGTVGSMADYLLNTVTELEKAGVHDPYMWRLQKLVAERLARLPLRA